MAEVVLDIAAGGKVAPDGAQLVVGDRLLDRQPALEAAHPEPGAVEVELVPAQPDDGAWRELLSEFLTDRASR